MAKAKNKNDIKLTNIKKNNVVVKNGAKAVAMKKKPKGPKKKLEIVDEVKKQELKETEIVKKVKKTNTTIKKELTQEEIIAQRKERNRKKYQNQQKKYQENKKNKEKKKIVIEDQVDEKVKKEFTDKEEDLVKKVIEKEQKSPKEKERKEKRKTNHKSIHFTQTLIDLKDKGVSKINDVIETTDDKYIPVGKTQEEVVKRSRRLITEAIVYAIILTIIDILCILIFDYFNFLRLFDIKWLNVITTIVIALIFNFFVAFMVDYFVTNIWLNKIRKKKVGGQDGDSRIIKEEHKEDIPNQERE